MDEVNESKQLTASVLRALANGDDEGARLLIDYTSDEVVRDGYKLLAYIVIVMSLIVGGEDNTQAAIDTLLEDM